MIETTCVSCQSALLFPFEQAGASGPCFQCGANVQVPIPSVIVHCRSCQAPSEFPITLVGQTGPCRVCSAPLTVHLPAPTPAPTPPAPPQVAPTNTGPRVVQPGDAQIRILKKLRKEAQKAGFTLEADRVLQLARSVSTKEQFGSALKARFVPGGTSIRTDRVLAVLLADARQRMVITVPFSGNLVLAHELCSVQPFGLPDSLWLTRGLMGSWSSGAYSTADAGPEAALAVAADQHIELNTGIEWNWESGRTVMKLDWGMQVVPYAPGQSLHLMHTAPMGIMFPGFGVAWYVKKTSAFRAFARSLTEEPQPNQQEFYVPPLSLLFPDLVEATQDASA